MVRHAVLWLRMRIRIHRKQPASWSVRKQSIKRAWTTPFWAFEWLCEWLAFVLNNWSLLEVLEYLGSFSVLIAVIFYFSESGDRIKQKHHQAWQVINSAQGKGGSGGRIDALQELNRDGVPLVGVDVSTAFLQGLRLPRAHLLRSNFHAADVRDSDLSFANLSDSDLGSANFRQSNLQSVSLQRADLTGADLTDANLSGANLDHADLAGADLTGVDLSGATLSDANLSDTTLTNLRWREISNLRNATIFGVKDPPEGFVAWALQHGAVAPKPDSRPSSIQTR
jgi:hypothetical protein